MYRDEILTITRLAHYFGSAYSRKQVHAMLRLPVEHSLYSKIVDSLIADGYLEEKTDGLFHEKLNGEAEIKRQRSRVLFKQHRAKLSFIQKMPWVRFVALSGANAFESCNGDSDIDLFVITAPQRLWLCYFLLVLVTKLLRVRPAFCLNYLIDENNQRLAQQDYFSAVQLTQMIPLTRNHLGYSLLQQNRWIRNFLPNAPQRLREIDFYRLQSETAPSLRRKSKLFDRFLASCNRFLLLRYRKRLDKKIGKLPGNSIYLTEGIAKLHPNDNHTIYELIFDQLAEAEAS